MYSLDEFGEKMVGDTLAFPAYRESDFARAGKTGDSVVDIGSGPGVSRFCVVKRARKKVYAIDTESAWNRGGSCGDEWVEGRIEFLRGDSRQILLPEP